jgi:predicted nucleic acid-binding protein
MSTDRPSSGSEATAFIRALLDQGGAELWQPGPVFGRRLLQLATERRIRGSHIHDLQIALTAFDNGATEIWSHDQSFASVPGLPVRDPLRTPHDPLGRSGLAV